MSRRKENPNVKDIEYYKEKSPLLKTFLNDKLVGNYDGWLEELKISFENKTMTELEEVSEEGWAYSTIALDAMAENFGLKNTDMTRHDSIKITSYIFGIGFEVGSVEGIDLVLNSVCDQLLQINYIHEGWTVNERSRLVASQIVRGTLGAGAVLNDMFIDDDDRLQPFSDFIEGLKL